MSASKSLGFYSSRGSGNWWLFRVRSHRGWNQQTVLRVQLDDSEILCSKDCIILASSCHSGWEMFWTQGIPFAHGHTVVNATICTSVSSGPPVYTEHLWDLLELVLQSKAPRKPRCPLCASTELHKTFNNNFWLLCLLHCPESSVMCHDKRAPQCLITKG